MDDLGRGVKSVTDKATTAVRGDEDENAEQRDGGEQLDLDELAERRRQREGRRERRRKAI